MDFKSKLPNTGTSIFSVMSALSNECGAVNLSQGFPDFPVDPQLMELVTKAMKDGHNQYAMMTGVPKLRERIGGIVKKFYNRNINPDTEVTVTSGATESLFAAISVIVNDGDEVIMFDPSYDSYEPAVTLNRGVSVRISLTFPDYKIDWNKVRDKINNKTRLIILNSPHNPTGSVISPEDLNILAEITRGKNIYILSDEVYEHITFDGTLHQSMMLKDELYEKSFIVSSFGKTFHITGWKVGYCTAPPNLTAEFRKIHQFLTFATSTPFQFALAEYSLDLQRIADLKKFYEEKHDYFLSLVRQTKFKPLECKGTYFQILDFSEIASENDLEFAKRLTRDYKVASVPVSVFYENKDDNKVLRFCFAKSNSTLEKAIENLSRL